MARPIIVFDLDGTLVDTAPDLLDSLNHSLAASDLAAVDETGFKRFVGQGLRMKVIARSRLRDVVSFPLIPPPPTRLKVGVWQPLPQACAS